MKEFFPIVQQSKLFLLEKTPLQAPGKEKPCRFVTRKQQRNPRLLKKFYANLYDCFGARYTQNLILARVFRLQQNILALNEPADPACRLGRNAPR